MKKGVKILFVWGAVTLGLGLIAGPQFGVPAFLMTSIAILVGIISAFLVVFEPNSKNKFLFLNFAVFFMIGILSVASNSIGPVMAKIDKYLPFVLVQWIKGANYLALAFAIVYLVLDSLFRDLGVRLKYIATIMIVGGFFIIYFGIYTRRPKVELFYRRCSGFSFCRSRILNPREGKRYSPDSRRYCGADHLASMARQSARREVISTKQYFANKGNFAIS